jgi:ferritin-like metal-binding protein YciE
MTTAQQKVVQYLDEARATERALTRQLQSQIAITPRGTYRNALETHLKETRRHAERVSKRLEDLGEGGGNPLASVLGAAESVAAQAVAISKTPVDMLRGTGGEEKILKNAKDSCAAESLEIATYTALEKLARVVDDPETAELAASIREEEERMLARIMRELPKLTAAVVGADVEGDPSYDITKTGAGEAAGDALDATRRVARGTGRQARRTARTARRVPGVARAEGQVKGALASEDDLAIAGYDRLSADEITSRLPQLSQVELAKIEAYERRNQGRTTILGRITTLRVDEPWPGYDELTAAEVQSALSDRDPEDVGGVRSYERAHKNRTGVIKATERERVNA